ncbi:fasciclin domain-containing protein [Jannaschia sp. LMIT008]|uniref:fasciclin domain-containing protein n=1 Tax=Jannaschia maritima TaxID=3032585 RepID=UPI002811231C|nr:fasciclin domain-containing protein [Jannaschia sp. LMIT008]
MRTQILTAACAIGVAFAGPAFAQDIPEEVGTAVDAAETAGVVETLVSGGPVTVFVPTNDAVSGVPEDALNELLGDTERLASVIQGYAVTGTLMAADVIELAESEGGSTQVETLGGGMLTVMVEGDTVTVGPSEDAMATVVTPDLTLGNITVHVIDTAFLPM